VQLAAAVGRPDPHAGELPVAYVQLQEGSDLTSEQILDYLKKEVGERAAVPKAVFIIEQVPLTPVGKIFKPALRWEAIRQVYQEELATLADMVESVNVTVKEDKVHGSLATITVKPASGAIPEDIRKRVDDILARYTIKYRLEIICEQGHHRSDRPRQGHVGAPED
ncbi:MAG: hypothetical protein JSU83_14565, partial [Deltaproteobacteria bacterium]